MRLGSTENYLLYAAGLALAGIVFVLLYITIIKDEITLAICFGLSGGIGVGFPSIYKTLKEKYFDN